MAISRDSRYYYERMKERRIRTMDSRIIDMTTMVNTPNEEKVFVFRDMQGNYSSMMEVINYKLALINTWYQLNIMVYHRN